MKAGEEERKKITIFLSKGIYEKMEELASHEKIDFNTMAERVLEMALEIWEDEILAEVAVERMKNYDPLRTLSDEEVWD